MAASWELVLSRDELVVDQGLGHPKAYAKLCRDAAAAVSAYRNGPPSTFLPYALQPQQASTAAELDELFPIDVVDLEGGEEEKEKPSAATTTNPKLFTTLLWKQLNHLGNAGFDPALFRVDPYGNVLYYHADDASPLAWDIGHWFPASRGGLSVPSNLRILQWQVCKRKHNKLDFMVPWWDLQLGISVNQFMSIFASSNSDFRHRAFSFLFLECENEELNASQTVDSHHFPQHYLTSQKKLGLAPAAIVLSRSDRNEASSVLKSLDPNRQARAGLASPMIVRKSTTAAFKENAAPDIVSANPYQAIVLARDSLTQREEAMKRQLEIQKLDDEVDELKQKNEEDKISIQELELKLMKSRKRAEKHRRLTEAQSSYRTMLEKMVRDAMHQSVVYKEQVRLNQAATNALNARLEAQKEICDASETELLKRYKLRDATEKRLEAKDLVQAGRRSRMNSVTEFSTDDKIVLSPPAPKMKVSSCSTRRDSLFEVIAEDATSKSPASRVRINPLFEDICNQALLSYAEKKRMASTMRKELRVFLEEEQRAAMIGLPGILDVEEQMVASENNFEHCRSSVAVETPSGREEQNLLCKIGGGEIAICEQPEKEEDDEMSRWQRGRGNIDRWLQMLLDNSQVELEAEDVDHNGGESSIGEIITPLNPQQSVKFPEHQGNYRKENKTEMNKKEGGGTTWVCHHRASSSSVEEEEETNAAGDLKITTREKAKPRASFEWRRVKEKSLPRSNSSTERSFRFISSSPSKVIMSMRKGVDCMRKKATVLSDEDQ